MNCIIIDDDAACRSALEQMISQVNGLNHTGSYETGVQAINTLKDRDTHLVLLDVEMPEMSGLDMLAELEIKPLVILTTTHTEYALEGYKHEIVDYLVKPFTLPQFINSISKAEKRFENLSLTASGTDKHYLFIRKDSVINKIPISDILWIEAMGDYVSIHTKDQRIVIHSTLKAIEEKLPKDKFIRVHRSYIVQIENIKTVEGTTIYIENKPIPVGIAYKDIFLKSLAYFG